MERNTIDKLKAKLTILDYLNDKAHNILDSETLTYTSDMEITRKDGQSAEDHQKTSSEQYRQVIREAHYSFDKLIDINMEVMELLSEFLEDIAD